MMTPIEYPIAEIASGGQLRKTFDIRSCDSFGTSLHILTWRRAGAAAMKAILRSGFVLDDVIFDSQGSEWVLLVARGEATDEATASLRKMGYVRTCLPVPHNPHAFSTSFA